MTVDLSCPEVAALFPAVPGLDVGAYFQIINPPAFVDASTVEQLAWGSRKRSGRSGSGR